MSIRSVIPEAAKYACGGESSKNNSPLDTGSRLRLVRYDVWDRFQDYSAACRDEESDRILYRCYVWWWNLKRQSAGSNAMIGICHVHFGQKNLEDKRVLQNFQWVVTPPVITYRSDDLPSARNRASSQVHIRRVFSGDFPETGGY